MKHTCFCQICKDEFKWFTADSKVCLDCQMEYGFQFDEDDDWD